MYKKGFYAGWSLPTKEESVIYYTYAYIHVTTWNEA